MTPRPGVFTRFDPDVLTAVDQLAVARKVSRAEVIRGMVEAGLKAEQRRQTRRGKVKP